MRAVDHSSVMCVAIGSGVYQAPARQAKRGVATLDGRRSARGRETPCACSKANARPAKVRARSQHETSIGAGAPRAGLDHRALMQPPLPSAQVGEPRPRAGQSSRCRRGRSTLPPAVCRSRASIASRRSRNRSQDLAVVSTAPRRRRLAHGVSSTMRTRSGPTGRDRRSPLARRDHSSPDTTSAACRVGARDPLPSALVRQSDDLLARRSSKPGRRQVCDITSRRHGCTPKRVAKGRGARHVLAHGRQPTRGRSGVGPAVRLQPVRPRRHRVDRPHLGAQTTWARRPALERIQRRTDRSVGIVQRHGPLDVTTSSAARSSRVRAISLACAASRRC